MLGPPLTGLLFDYTGSFDWTFYLAGIFFIISAAFCYLVKVNENPTSTENLKATK